MVKIRSLAEAEKVLAYYIPKVREMLGKDLTLDRMLPLMKLLGNPEDKIKIIHIAGTSGKTSTSYFIAGILQRSGKKVGLTVSPHIDIITERIQINGTPISEEDFCAALEIFESIVRESEIEPTYFEYLIAFVYWYFEREKVDYAVVETGLGGLHDCTNVAKRADKVCVITDIGLDHVHVLGNTIKEIASQKAGIIHSGNVCLMYDQSEEVRGVFTAYAQKQGADLLVLDSSSEYSKNEKEHSWVNDLPEFQKRNFGLALSATNYVARRDGWIVHNNDLAGLLDVRVPGRMDIASVNNKNIIMDGAHNTQKMEAFVDSFVKKYGDKKVPVLFSVKSNKDCREIVSILAPITSQAIITGFSVIQYRKNMSADINEISEIFVQNGVESKAVENQSDAYNEFMERVKNIGIITGSFYLISELRKKHAELKNGKTN